ncbi:MAG: co-chaperone GroES [Coriobacteriia bacterium]|nr:co-chaperone GroES [Coriobacteriia bacterium]
MGKLKSVKNDVTTHNINEVKERTIVGMKLRPLGDRIVVKAEEAETKTQSGLYLTTNSQEKPQRGEVIAVGEGKFDNEGKRIPVDVKVGDKVIYGKYGGTEIKVDEEEYLILRADDIYAVVE